MSLRLVLYLIDKKLRGQLKSGNGNAHLPPSPHLERWHQNSLTEVRNLDLDYHFSSMPEY